MTKQATARRARSAPDQERKLHQRAVIDLSKGRTIPLVASFRRIAPPHPGFGDLAFDGAGGALAATVAGRVLRHAGRLVRGRR